jgi:hypothetical protein
MKAPFCVVALFCRLPDKPFMLQVTEETPNAKDLIRPAVQESGQHTRPHRGRADKSRLNGTAAFLTPGAMGILASLGGPANHFPTLG